MKINSVSLNIFRTCCILGDNGPDDRENSKQDEESDGEFEGTEKVKEYGKDPLFLSPYFILRFFHKESYAKRNETPAAGREVFEIFNTNLYSLSNKKG